MQLATDNETKSAVLKTATAVDPGPRSLLERMLLIRNYEERISTVQGVGTCTSVGQEASAVGVVSALAAEDLILTNHRSAGHLLARGADPGRILAEVMGRATGYCKGKSGSLHVSVKELGVILTSTIVGGELSLAPGVALSQTMLEKPGIVVCFFGDGAACEGVFHESINLAAVWNLPILYVCENNQWQAYVTRRETMLADHISTWAAPYGVASRTVDGNDVEAVQAAAAEAASQVRRTGKPFLLETYTYRMRGHFEPDDQSYVDKGELAQWAAKDPIARLKNRLLADGIMTAGEAGELEREVRERIEAAVVYASSSPFPEPGELTTDVYAEGGESCRK